MRSLLNGHHLSRTEPAEKRARACSYVGIGWQLGVLAAAFLAPALLPHIGWRGVFWVLCGLTTAVALWIFLSVPEKPRNPGPTPTIAGYLGSSARILISPTFWRFGPAVATISTFNFAYLGLWAGPWLRDVAGMDGETRAGVLFLYTLAMVAGSVLTGMDGCITSSCGTSTVTLTPVKSRMASYGSLSSTLVVTKVLAMARMV